MIMNTNAVEINKLSVEEEWNTHTSTTRSPFNDDPAEKKLKLDVDSPLPSLMTTSTESNTSTSARSPAPPSPVHSPANNLISPPPTSLTSTFPLPITTSSIIPSTSTTSSTSSTVISTSLNSPTSATTTTTITADVTDAVTAPSSSSSTSSSSSSSHLNLPLNPALSPSSRPRSPSPIPTFTSPIPSVLPIESTINDTTKTTTTTTTLLPLDTSTPTISSVTEKPFPSPPPVPTDPFPPVAVGEANATSSSSSSTTSNSSASRGSSPMVMVKIEHEESPLVESWDTEVSVLPKESVVIPSKIDSEPVKVVLNGDMNVSEEKQIFVSEDVIMAPVEEIANLEEDDKKMIEVEADKEPKTPSLPSLPSAPPVPMKPMGPLQSKHCLSTLRVIKRLKDAAMFLHPVDPVKLNIPDYFDIIHHPMDLGTMEKKLLHQEYTTVNAYIDDFNLMVQNCILYNGSTSIFSTMANNLKRAFDRHMERLPPFEPISSVTSTISGADSASLTGSSKSSLLTKSQTSKQAGKAPKPSIHKLGSTRRSSSSSAAAANAVPTSVLPSMATFHEEKSGFDLTSPSSSTSALGSAQSRGHYSSLDTNVNLSSISNSNLLPTSTTAAPLTSLGKRQLPSSSSSSFSSSKKMKPSKPMLSEELKLCYQLVKEFFKKQCTDFTAPFLAPVDRKLYPHYYDVIKSPIDLETIRKRLEDGYYSNAISFEADMQLLFKNCYKFNPAGTEVRSLGQKFESVWLRKWQETLPAIKAAATAAAAVTPVPGVNPMTSNLMATPAITAARSLPTHRKNSTGGASHTTSKIHRRHGPTATHATVATTTTNDYLGSNRSGAHTMDLVSNLKSNAVSPSMLHPTAALPSISDSSEDEDMATLAILEQNFQLMQQQLETLISKRRERIRRRKEARAQQLKHYQQAGAAAAFASTYNNSPASSGLAVGHATSVVPSSTSSSRRSSASSSRSTVTASAKGASSSTGRGGSSSTMPTSTSASSSASRSKAASTRKANAAAAAAAAAAVASAPVILPSPAVQVTHEMKRELTEKINDLPSDKLQQVVAIIQESMPQLIEGATDEIELDIALLDDSSLFKLWQLVTGNTHPSSLATSSSSSSTTTTTTPSSSTALPPSSLTSPSSTLPSTSTSTSSTNAISSTSSSSLSKKPSTGNGVSTTTTTPHSLGTSTGHTTSSASLLPSSSLGSNKSASKLGSTAKGPTALSSVIRNSSDEDNSDSESSSSGSESE